MSRDRGRTLVWGLALSASLVAFPGDARADELVGKVKSVDAEARKVVITEEGTRADRELVIDPGTTWTKEKKGKASKKFDLAKLKVGASVEVTREGDHASRILIKAAKKKAKAA